MNENNTMVVSASAVKTVDNFFNGNSGFYMPQSNRTGFRARVKQILVRKNNYAIAYYVNEVNALERLNIVKEVRGKEYTKKDVFAQLTKMMNEGQLYFTIEDNEVVGWLVDKE